MKPPMGGTNAKALFLKEAKQVVWTRDVTVPITENFDTVKNGNGCLYRTTAHSYSHWDYSTGFRCCADYKP